MSSKPSNSLLHPSRALTSDKSNNVTGGITVAGTKENSSSLLGAFANVVEKSSRGVGGVVGGSTKSRDVLSNVTNNSSNNNLGGGNTTKSAKKGDSKVSSSSTANNKNSTTGGNKGDKSSKRSASVASLLEATGGGNITSASSSVSTSTSTSSSLSSSSTAVSAVVASASTVVTLAEEKPHKKTKSDAMAIVSEEDSSLGMALMMQQQNIIGNCNGRIMPNIPHEDIDAEDHSDPQSVHEYVNDIYTYLMAKERTDRLTPNLLSRQTEVTEKMRAILIDWLIEVHRMFKLLPETLFLAVNIIDRYLDARSVLREKLQLVGITSMLIASKYEEIYAPECNDFVYISDSAYAKEEILSMEQNILNVLDFNLTHPSPLHFLRRYSKAAGSDYTAHTLCKYLIELTLIDVKMLKYTASQVAASSVYIARSMMKKTPVWSQTMVYYSTYTEQEVREVALEMNDLLKKIGKSSLKAIKKKYGTAKFSNVSDIPWVDL